MPGLHEPLISEAQFYEVQDVLNGRSRKKASLPRTKVSSDIKLPLRGFLACPSATERSRVLRLREEIAIITIIIVHHPVATGEKLLN